MEDLTGKHILITGGSSGIGLQVIRKCLEQGATVGFFNAKSVIYEQRLVLNNHTYIYTFFCSKIYFNINFKITFICFLRIYNGCILVDKQKTHDEEGWTAFICILGKRKRFFINILISLENRCARHS